MDEIELVLAESGKRKILRRVIPAGRGDAREFGPAEVDRGGRPASTDRSGEDGRDLIGLEILDDAQPRSLEWDGEEPLAELRVLGMIRRHEACERMDSGESCLERLPNSSSCSASTTRSELGRGAGRAELVAKLEVDQAQGRGAIAPSWSLSSSATSWYDGEIDQGAARRHAAIARSSAAKPAR